jgi:mRNA interferase MazF
MRRGDIYRFQFAPSVGSEARSSRPAVVVSNNGANSVAARRNAGVITVVPLTKTIHTVYPFQVLLRAEDTGLPHDSKAQIELIRAVDLSRHIEYVGHISTRDLARVDQALRIHLSI